MLSFELQTLHCNALTSLLFSNKPSPVSQTALLTGHGGVASRLTMCQKKSLTEERQKGQWCLGSSGSKSLSP